MPLKIPDKVDLEKFVIENNIIKGVYQELSDDFQIGKLLFDTLNSNLDHVLQIDAETGKQTTFAKMKDRSVRCAIWLKKQGIGSHDVICIRSDDNVNAYIPIFASFFLGATYNAWNHITSIEYTLELMKNIQPKIIFVSSNTTEFIIHAAKLEHKDIKIITFDKDQDLQSLDSLMEEQSAEEVSNFQPVTVTNSEDLAYIILSSGTTAFPKPIMHSYGNFVKQIAVFFPMNGVVLWYCPSYWISGFLATMGVIFNYGTRIIHSKFDPEETSKIIEKYKVEQLLLSSPAVSQYCQSNVLKTYQLKSLKLIYIVGSKANPRMLEEFRQSLPHVNICQALGCSELGRGIASQTEKSKNIYSVGFALPCIEIKIRDLQTNEALGLNKYGEICVKCSTTMKGYCNNEEATKKCIDEEGWFHTGDVAYYNKDGEFIVTDRMSDAINYQNYQIWPSEIEDNLLRRQDILEAVVVPVPHETDGERPITFVKTVPGANVLNNLLCNWDLTFIDIELTKILHLSQYIANQDGATLPGFKTGLYGANKFFVKYYLLSIYFYLKIKRKFAEVREEELMKSLKCMREHKKIHVAVKIIDEVPRLSGGKIIRRKLIEMAKTLT